METKNKQLMFPWYTDKSFYHRELQTRLAHDMGQFDLPKGLKISKGWQKKSK